MAQKKRSAHGSGSIRQRPDGRWEARFTYQDELGQPKRGSVYGATQKEVRQQLTAVEKQIDDGTYRKRTRYTVAEWLNEWLVTYGTTWKPFTVNDYRGKIARYIVPNLGRVQLSALTPMQVQRFCNRLSEGHGEQAPLSAKTVKNVHGILHSALKQAVLAGVLPTNPADNTKLPKVQKPELQPLMDDNISRFLAAARGDPFERLFIVDLFTGLRQSELLALEWQDVDLDGGELTVRRQLQRLPGKDNYIFLDQTKNGKSRVVPLAPGIVEVFRNQRREQSAMQLAAGAAWENARGLVFTDELGRHLKHNTVYLHFKKVVKSIGMENTRFHDLRHSCAVLALQSGCSVKAVQEQLGHYSSAFTMDVYASVSDAMKRDTQARLEAVFEDAVSRAK